MAGSIFLTGASGFVGSRLLPILAADPNRRIVCLSRRKPAGSQSGNVEFIAADLLDAKSYSLAMAGCETVVHLAAATGKQAPAEYLRVNRDGTEALVLAARQAGIQRFLYVSSIAAKFADISRYYYAQSKQQAEAVVKRSGLQWLIVRPTIVLGEGSPVLASLSRLASLPIVPVFGNGHTLVQPIIIDDLAACLAKMLADGDRLFDCRTIEIGGPEFFGMEDLLLRIRLAQGGGPARVIHLPARPIAACLGWIEPFLRPLLPFTAGQLASFTSDGTITTDPWVKQQLTRIRKVDEMFQSVALNAAQLERECRTYTRYLIGRAPTEYVIERYLHFHKELPAEVSLKAEPFDDFVVRVSARSPLWARLADCYASVFRKNSDVRKKIVLTLALLECTTLSFETLDQTRGGTQLGTMIRLGCGVAQYVLAVVVSAVIFTPVRMGLALFSKSRQVAIVER